MNFAVFCSGKGSTLEFLLSKQATGQLLNQINLVVTDNPTSNAILIAEKYKIPALIIPPRNYPNMLAWDAALVAQLSPYSLDFILLAGFLRKVGTELLNKFHNKIVNSHPSLLPKFGGKGMYGTNVHQAVLASNESETGVTIHLANAEFDKGAILLQKKIKIESDWTVEDVENNVKILEKETLVDFLNHWRPE